jgi:hypothetical protein
MVISRDEFQPVINDFSKFVVEGKIPELASVMFQKQQNQVADELGIGYKNDIGLYDLFDYCETNNIDNESVNLLFSALKNNNQNVKNWYGDE